MSQVADASEGHNPTPPQSRTASLPSAKTPVDPAGTESRFRRLVQELKEEWEGVATNKGDHIQTLREKYEEKVRDQLRSLSGMETALFELDREHTEMRKTREAEIAHLKAQLPPNASTGGKDMTVKREMSMTSAGQRQQPQSQPNEGAESMHPVVSIRERLMEHIEPSAGGHQSDIRPLSKFQSPSAVFPGTMTEASHQGQALQRHHQEENATQYPPSHIHSMPSHQEARPVNVGPAQGLPAPLAASRSALSGPLPTDQAGGAASGVGATSYQWDAPRRGAELRGGSVTLRPDGSAPQHGHEYYNQGLHQRPALGTVMTADTQNRSPAPSQAQQNVSQ